MLPEKLSKFKYEQKWTDEKKLLHLSDLILNIKHASYDTCKMIILLSQFDSSLLVKVILPVSILIIFCLYK